MVYNSRLTKETMVILRAFHIVALTCLSMSPCALGVDPEMVDPPNSEPSFDCFSKEDGKRSSLPYSHYTSYENEIIQQNKQRLLKPNARKRDEIIAFHLVNQIIKLHRESIVEDMQHSCFFIPSTSLPATRNLREIARHGLHGRKILGCFGRNRTFEILSSTLKWIDSNNKPTVLCPYVFSKIWNEVILESRAYVLR